MAFRNKNLGSLSNGIFLAEVVSIVVDVCVEPGNVSADSIPKRRGCVNMCFEPGNVSGGSISKRRGCVGWYMCFEQGNLSCGSISKRRGCVCRLAMVGATSAKGPVICWRFFVCFVFSTWFDTIQRNQKCYLMRLRLDDPRIVDIMQEIVSL